MPLEVYTAQIRYVKAKMPDALDITRVGNWMLQKARQPSPGAIFAPSWELFNDCKAGGVSEQEYTKRFLDDMRLSYRALTSQWKAILALPRVVLCCYEPYPEFCHRHILRERILPALGAIDCGEIEVMKTKMHIPLPG
jgi:hypothetical protein